MWKYKDTKYIISVSKIQEEKAVAMHVMHTDIVSNIQPYIVYIKPQCSILMLYKVLTLYYHQNEAMDYFLPECVRVRGPAQEAIDIVDPFLSNSYTTNLLPMIYSQDIQQ